MFETAELGHRVAKTVFNRAMPKLRSWYTAPIIERVFRKTGRSDLLQSIEEITRFEKMLADEGADAPYRSLTAGKALLGAMKKRLDAPAGRGRPVSKAAPIVHPIDERDVLTELDLRSALTEKAYKTGLPDWQGRLNRLARDAKFPRLSVALAFEGMDAAGKEERAARKRLDARLLGDQRFRGAARFKRFKITSEDWRNREKWDLYQSAAADMIERTSTTSAPWTLVEANDKKFARIKVLKTICKRIENALDAL